MLTLYLATLIIEACFVYHVYKTRRPYWWALIVLAIPKIGAIVYYLWEIFPGSPEQRSIARLAARLSRKLNAHEDLRRRIAAAEANPTVNNKVALADAYLQHGRAAQAAALLQSCVVGAHERDPQLLYFHASALVEAGHYAEAVERLQQLRALDAAFKPNELALLAARLFEGAKEYEHALAAYETVIERFVGLEARVRRAWLLERLGRRKLARQAYRDITALARKIPPSLESERVWVRRARRRVAFI
jgi:hypothetical protein